MRSHCNQPITDNQGNLLVGATVTVYDWPSGTVLPQAMYIYDDDSLAPVVVLPTDPDMPPLPPPPLTYANPFNTQTGVVDFYLDTPQRVRLYVVPMDGSAPFSVIREVFPPAQLLVTSLGSLTIVNAPAAGQVLTAIDANTAQWAAPV